MHSTFMINSGIMGCMKGPRFLAFAALLCLGGCSSKTILSADQYFSQAHEDFRRGALAPAIEAYRELLDHHPFSEYTEEAELRIAHAQYLDGDYTSAIVSLTDFQRRHPTSPFLPFVGYYLGMCYARQMGTIDRDQTAAQNAHTYFNTLIHQYPDSPFASLASQQLSRCRESMAAHEMSVARYYKRLENHKAAEVRLLDLAAQYGDTRVGADALLELTGIYADANNHEYATLAYRALNKLHPAERQTEEARKHVEFAKVDVPPSADPLDLLLIANGRTRPSETLAAPPVPIPMKPPPSGPSPLPTIDPFGRADY